MPSVVMRIQDAAKLLMLDRLLLQFDWQRTKRGSQILGRRARVQRTETRERQRVSKGDTDRVHTSLNTTTLERPSRAVPLVALGS
jgi:hypothetical protein